MMLSLAWLGSSALTTAPHALHVALQRDVRMQDTTVVTAVDTAPGGPRFTKPLSQPDPVPEEGQARALELLKSGALFRYTPGVLSEVALAEEAICEYTGFKYAVGFNSCGSALFIALKCVGVEPGDGVLANAFSFTAVPSAIHHASATPVYVESTDSYVMDVEDLRRKVTPDTKYLMLTHMRGKVADMKGVYEVADEFGIQVVEDCAHALGVQWEGVQLGRSARVACFSTQSAKVINSGEGGFLCTDDPEVAARAACYAGCYEQLYNQHLSTCAPEAKYFEAVKKETPNYSLRMSDLTASCITPCFRKLEERIEKYNRRYARVAERMSTRAEISVPPIDSRVRPVADSLQFNLVGLEGEQVAAFVANCKARGLTVGLFGSKDNARNFRNWKYSPAQAELPRTERLIAAAIDVRLPESFSDSDLDLLTDVIHAAMDDVLSDVGI